MSRLREAGWDVAEAHLQRIVPPADERPLRAALARLGSGDYDWLVFTSARAVAAVCDRSPQAVGSARIACVGPSTARRVREAGYGVDLVPDVANAAALGAALGRRLRPGQRVLFPRAANAGPALKASLVAVGAEVDDPVAYETQPEPAGAAQLQAALASGVNAAIFASGTAIAEYVACGGPFDVMAVCIGPVTAAAAREAGLRRVAVAEAPTADAVAACLGLGRDGDRPGQRGGDRP